MSETEDKRSRIKDKIAASQERLRRDTVGVPPVRHTLPDAHPPQNYRSLAAEYPWLSVAGGLAVGALLGALLPKTAGSKFSRRAMGFASVAAELGLALSRQARDAAGDAAESGATRLGEIGHRIDEGTADLRTRARRQAGIAASSTRSTGQRVMREAIRIATKARK